MIDSEFFVYCYYELKQESEGVSVRAFFILFISLFWSGLLFAKTLVFGIVPQQSPMELAKMWVPMVSYLETATGQKIHLRIEHSIPEFEKALYRGEYDIAYMNPYHYIVAHKRKEYTAYARDTKKIIGIIVVRKDSGITDPSELKGKRFLFPAPDAFAATLLTKYDLLKKYGINIEEEKNFRYVNSHDSVYKGVARDIGDAGGGIERTLNTLDDPRVKASLNIVYKTDAYPSHPFAFLPSVPDDIREKIVSSLQKAPAALLEPLKMKQIIPTDDREYNRIRSIADALPSLQDY